MRALIAAVVLSALSACQTTPGSGGCGVIRDSLKTVNATAPEGRLRLAVHYERGRAAGCW